MTPEVLGRYLARTEAPYLRQVVPLVELVDRLPPGLCARLLAIPVRRDAITGTVDVVVADASDPHPAKEIAFHLGAPVRAGSRRRPTAIEEALRRLRSRSLPPSARPDARDTRELELARDDERIYDSRPRAAAPASSFKGGTLPPPAPSLKLGYSGHAALDAMTSEALRPSRVPVSERQAHVVPAAPSAHAALRPAPPLAADSAMGHTRA